MSTATQTNVEEMSQPELAAEKARLIQKLNTDKATVADAKRLSQVRVAIDTIKRVKKGATA